MLRNLLKISLSLLLIAPIVAFADSDQQRLKQLRADLTNPSKAHQRTAINNEIKSLEKKLNTGANRKKDPKPSGGGSKPTTTPRTSSGPVLTVAGSATPTVSLASAGGEKSITINSSEGEPDVFIPNGMDWFWVTDITPSSMTIIWDPNNVPKTRTGYFYVNTDSKSVKVNVSQPKGSPAYVQITDVKFFNMRGQSQLTEPGETLYADEMRQLGAEITYNGTAADQTKKVHLKIYNPNGTLRTASSSRDGYSTSTTVDFWGKTWGEKDNLNAIGNTTASTFDAGRYYVEVYLEDDLVHHGDLYINAKGGHTTYLTVDNSEDVTSYFIADAESNTHRIRTDGSWAVMDLPEWCKAHKQGDNLVLTVDDNPYYSSRSHTMHIVSGDRSLPIYLYQNGK